MRVVIQRVSESDVKVSGNQIGKIGNGFVVLASFEDDDTDGDLDWMSKKIINLRIFNDEDRRMNKSLLDVGGDILLISQFTLHGSTKKGNRPSFIKAAKPEYANQMYEKFIEFIESSLGKKFDVGPVINYRKIKNIKKMNPVKILSLYLNHLDFLIESIDKIKTKKFVKKTKRILKENTEPKLYEIFTTFKKNNKLI